jgi:hypothetical protein
MLLLCGVVDERRSNQSGSPSPAGINKHRRPTVTTVRSVTFASLC